MRPLAVLDAELGAFKPGLDAGATAQTLLGIAEEALEQWILARGEQPTHDQREGFRLLALHRQGARGTPSFNACRESCREIAYHYNMLRMEPDHEDVMHRQRMMALLAKHLVLFISGKMEVEGLGEFCCASRPLRLAASEQGG